nr:hypothetical protein [Candidatus Freyrarchaeum guaymaensis]
MRGWDSPDSLAGEKTSTQNHLLYGGGFRASLLDESGSSLRKLGVVHIALEADKPQGCSHEEGSSSNCSRKSFQTKQEEKF